MFKTETMKGNQSLNCTKELPSAKDYFPDVSFVYKMIFGATGILTLLVVLIYAETVYFLHRHDKERKKFPGEKVKWILAIYPVFCVTSLVGLLIPRSSNVNRLIATVYLAGNIYQFVTMLINNHGGPDEMAEKMEGLRMRIIPFFSSDCSMPKVTRRSLRCIEKIILIFTVLSTILIYVMAVIWANQHYYDDVKSNPSLYINIIIVVLTVFAVWGIRIVENLSAMIVGDESLKPKVICLQLVVVCNNFQSSFISIFIISQIIRCDEQLSAEAVGLRYHHILIIIEMFCIFLAARRFYRRIYPADEGFRIISYKRLELTEASEHVTAGVPKEESQSDSFYDNKELIANDKDTAASTNSDREC